MIIPALLVCLADNKQAIKKRAIYTIQVLCCANIV